MIHVKNIDIEIEAAAEYYFDKKIIQNVAKKELLSFGDNYVLFELPYTKCPEALENTVKKMISLGYKPVLAHSKRYRFRKEVFDYMSLKKLRLLVQVNINSLGGYYGKGAQQKS